MIHRHKKRYVWWGVGVLVAVVLSGGVWFGVQRYDTAPLGVTPQLEQISLENGEATPLHWPEYGQAAVATKEYGVITTHGSDQPQSTASTAKLITVLAVMQKRPFTDSKGAAITFRQADADLYQTYVAGNGSVTPVSAGLQWTQYQALQAILLASANNVSDSLAIWAFGSMDAYRQYAQQMVENLGMQHTTIGRDASGYHATTTSTASDLAILAAKVLDEPMLRQIIGQSQVALPGAGVIDNTNRLLGDSEIFGMKTGYIPEAGGVFVLAGRQTSGEHSQEIITVVMGAPGGSSRVAQTAAYALYQSAKANFTYQQVVTSGKQIGYYRPAWSDQTVAVTTSSQIGMFVWGGSAPDVKVRASEVLPGAAGEVGQVTVAFGKWSASAPLTVQQDIAAPSWWWRVITRG